MSINLIPGRAPSSSSVPAGRILVNTYGVHYQWARRLPREVSDQLWLAHRLREDFVESTLVYERQVKDIWSSYPCVAEAEQRLAVCEEELARVRGVEAEARVQARSRVVDAQVAAGVRRARAEVKQARVDRRMAIAGVVVEARSRLVEAKTVMVETRRGLYRRYCSEGVEVRDLVTGGLCRQRLYHATFHDVQVHHETAEKRVAERRRRGLPAQMRHHGFDGTGSVCVVLLRQAGWPARTPMVVADPGGKYRNVLAMPWVDDRVWEAMGSGERHREGRRMVRMRVGFDTEGRATFVDLPVVMHRMFPAQADITGARLTISRRGKRRVAALSVTAKGVPVGEVAEGGGSVVLHWGWRDCPDGSGVEVARWMSDRPLAVPAGLCGVLRSSDGGCSGVVVVPEGVCGQLDWVGELQSRVDAGFNEAKRLACDLMGVCGPVVDRSGVVVGAGDVARWKSPGRLVRLIRAQRVDDARWDELRWWAGRHVHGETVVADTRMRALNRRDDVYRRVGAVFAGQVSVVGVDGMDLSAVAVLPSRVDVPDVVARAVSRRRVYAAPGVLRQAVVNACVREGVRVEVLDSGFETRTHWDCGYTNPADGKWVRAVVECDGCGRSYDQNVNALAHLRGRLGLVGGV